MTTKEQIQSINANTNYIGLFLIVLIFQGCFGCNKCEHKEPKPQVKQASIPERIESVKKELKRIDEKYAFPK